MPPLQEVKDMYNYIDKLTLNTLGIETRSNSVLKELHRVLKPAGLVSAYCPHLPTHTDVESEKDIMEEFTAEGFAVERTFRAGVRHNGNIVRGHILSFVRPSDRGRGAC